MSHEKKSGKTLRNEDVVLLPRDPRQQPPTFILDVGQAARARAGTIMDETGRSVPAPVVPDRRSSAHAPTFMQPEIPAARPSASYLAAPPDRVEVSPAAQRRSQELKAQAQGGPAPFTPGEQAAYRHGRNTGIAIGVIITAPAMTALIGLLLYLR